jgi:hypothetical protein
MRDIDLSQPIKIARKPWLRHQQSSCESVRFGLASLIIGIASVFSEVCRGALLITLVRRYQKVAEFMRDREASPLDSRPNSIEDYTLLLVRIG